MSKNEEIEKHEQAFFYTFVTLSTVVFVGLLIFLVCGCQYMPWTSKTIDRMEAQDSVNVTIDRETLQNKSDLHLSLDFVNKDTPETK